MCVRIKDYIYLGKDGIKFSPRRTSASKACEGGLGPGSLRFCASPEVKTGRRFSGCQSEDGGGPCWVAPPWRQCFPSQSSHVLTSLGTSSLPIELVSTSTLLSMSKTRDSPRPSGERDFKKISHQHKVCQSFPILAPRPHSHHSYPYYLLSWIIENKTRGDINEKKYTCNLYFLWTLLTYYTRSRKKWVEGT